MSVQQDQIKIPHDRKRMRRRLFGATIFMALGIWHLFTPLINFQFRFNGYWFIFISLVLAFHSVKKLISNKDGFLVDSTGIQGYSGSFYFGPILWNDITNVKIIKVLWQKYIVIVVNNPQGYINKENAFKKLTMNSNDVFFNSPFCINAEELDISADDLFQQIDNKRKSHDFQSC
jgi:hypothetical protein